MRKPRPYETTCTCRAYSFPHRFGGGRCTGKWVVSKTWHESYGDGTCAACNLSSESSEGKYCEVMEGQEDVRECPAYQEFVEYHEIRLY